MGIMQHFKCYKIKRKILYEKPNVFYKYGYFTSHFDTFKLKGRFLRDGSSPDDLVNALVES